MILAAMAVAAGCLAVDGERILARDVAIRFPTWSAVPAETPVAYAPVPGAVRVFSAAEWQRLAMRFGVPEGEAAEVCVQRTARKLEPAELLEAMRAALNVPEARIDIVEAMRGIVPAGKLVFPRTGLDARRAGVPDAPLLWRGWIETTPRRRFPVWARVRIRVKQKRVVAATALVAGRTIEAAQLRIDEIEGPPPAEPEAETVEQAAGRQVMRGIPAGSPIPLRLVAVAPVVEAGDVVTVEVRAGAAKLAFAARAESPGVPGQLITFRNPQSGKTFRARMAREGRIAILEVPR